MVANASGAHGRMAPFAEFFVRQRLIVPGNVAATAENIVASQSLFRAGFVSDLVVFVIEVALAAVLFMAVGEHLGYLSTSVWTILVAVVILRTGILPRWMGAIGVVVGVGIAAGLAEPAGWDLGGTINTYSYLVWALWLIAFGVILLTGRVKPALVAPPAPRAEASAAS